MDNLDKIYAFSLYFYAHYSPTPLPKPYWLVIIPSGKYTQSPSPFLEKLMEQLGIILKELHASKEHDFWEEWSVHFNSQRRLYQNNHPGCSEFIDNRSHLQNRVNTSKSYASKQNAITKFYQQFINTISDRGEMIFNFLKPQIDYLLSLTWIIYLWIIYSPFGVD